MYAWVTMLSSRNRRNIVNKLYFNKNNFKNKNGAPICLHHQITIWRTTVLGDFVDTQWTLPKQEIHLPWAQTLRFQD